MKRKNIKKLAINPLLIGIMIATIGSNTYSCHNYKKKMEATKKEAQEANNNTTKSIYLRSPKSKKWYRDLNSYIEKNKIKKLILDSDNKDNLNLSKIDLSKIDYLSLSGKIDVSTLPAIESKITLTINSECYNIESVPKVHELIITDINIREDDSPEYMEEILKKIEKNGNTPSTLHLDGYNITNVPIKTQNLIISSSGFGSDTLTVNTENLSIYGYKNGNKNIETTAQQPSTIQKVSTYYRKEDDEKPRYEITSIVGNYKHLLISNYDIDFNKIKNFNNIRIQKSNIEQTSIEEIINYSIPIFEITLNGDTTNKYYSKDIQGERNYYQITADNIDYLDNVVFQNTESTDTTKKILKRTNK